MITRRKVLQTTAAVAGYGMLDSRGSAEPDGSGYENPYEAVEWDTWTTLDSMSHQHQGQTIASLEVFREMGYGHFAFSNYYPSAPTFPLPAAWQAKHPEIIAAPNAEQHSFLDAGLHANSLGSLLATGYGADFPSTLFRFSPLKQRFAVPNVFSGPRPWEGVYRLDLRFESKDAKSSATLRIEQATECAFQPGFPEKGQVRERSLAAGNHTFYLRAEAREIDVTLVFDPAILTITQFRLMQGSNRPWREVFRAALDGEMVDGIRKGGLLHSDGGGITLNHPTGKRDAYLPMLDFDPRVLGIEVWNQLTSGFGSDRGFYDTSNGAAPDHFYRLWDEILATGRRCWGFFVKDHNTYGRGRNVLLLPSPDTLDPGEREAAALRAYRQGTFFGAVSSITANDEGEVVAPFDRSGFRFRRLVLTRDAGGLARSLQVAVGGQDAGRRPRVQIRIITEKGISAVFDAEEGEWTLPRDASGKPLPRFLRIEAIAYPDTHANGQALTAELIRGMRVAEIARLHDRQIGRGRNFFGNPAELRTPLPVADLIFSQPIRRI